MRKLLVLLLALVLLGMTGFAVTGCGNGSSPAEEVYQED